MDNPIFKIIVQMSAGKILYHNRTLAVTEANALIRYFGYKLLKNS